MCSAAGNLWDSAPPLFLVRSPAVWVVTLSVFGSPLASSSPLTAPQQSAPSGGALHIKAIRRPGLWFAGGVCWVRRPLDFFHTCAGWNFPADFFFFFSLLATSSSLRLWLSQSAGKLSICRLSLGCKLTPAPRRDNESLPPRQARWRPPDVSHCF